jgi:hypothetical protein
MFVSFKTMLAVVCAVALVFVFIAMLSSTVMTQTPAPEKPALDIAVTGVTQRSSDLFEIHYALKNSGSVDLYLPYHQIAGSIALTTYSLLQRTSEGAWTNVGPSYDVPSYRAQIVHPGATLGLVEPISASAVGIHPGAGSAPSGPSIEARSYYRIRVGYYTGAAAWQKRLNTMKEQQQSHETLRMPRIEFAYSEQFQIPSVAK